MVTLHWKTYINFQLSLHVENIFQNITEVYKFINAVYLILFN